MKALCVFGRCAYGDEARGLGYENVNFVPGLQRLGWDIVLFDSWDRGARTDFADLNFALLETVRKELPDVVFCVLMSYEIWTETLDLIRRCSRAVVLNWGTDDSWKYAQFSRYVAPHVDLWASTSMVALEAASHDGLTNVVRTQWAANGDRLVEPLPGAACRYAVSFVGSAYGNRRRWVTALRSRGIDVACFGHGWPSGPVSTEEVSRIYRESFLTLNLGDSGLQLEGMKLRRSRQLKARVFEVPGAGGCLVTETALELASYYRLGHEVVVFSTPDELAAQVKHLLDRPGERDAIARAGHARTRQEHTYESRFSQLLSPQRLAALSRVDAPDAEWNVAFESLRRLAAAHRQLGGLRAVRAFLTGPFSIAWGPRRGRRAARRILHELSWRLAGARTYGAMGWPGRLFYRES